MGIFDSIWSGIKSAASSVANVGGKILGGIGSVGGKILGVANKVRGYIGKGLDIVSKVPVVGGLVNKALDMPIPGAGVSLRNIAGVADSALDTANQVADIASNAGDILDSAKRGDLEGVVANAKTVYQQGRAVVDSAQNTRDAYRGMRDRRRQILNNRG